MEESQTKFFPKGQPTEPFDRKASGTFQSDLYNLALDKDVSKKRNLIYLGLVGLCVIATVFVTVTSSYKTYVVRVDNTTGQVEAGGELKSTNYNPRDKEIEYFLQEFILQTRTVPLDPVQYRLSLDKSQHFLTQEAAQKMSNLTKDNPVSKLGHMTVQPQIRSIQLQPGSKTTYQVRWTEEEYSLTGSTSGKKVNYIALFSVVVDQKGMKEEELRINPLSLKIKDLNITKETEG